jgi:DNA polymerase III gamma/tau subunit
MTVIAARRQPSTPGSEDPGRAPTPRHLILATTEKTRKSIPPSISDLPRRQIHDFNRISVNDIVDQLKRIAYAEGHGLIDKYLIRHICRQG